MPKAVRRAARHDLIAIGVNGWRIRPPRTYNPEVVGSNPVAASEDRRRVCRDAQYGFVLQRRVLLAQLGDA